MAAIFRNGCAWACLLTVLFFVFLFAGGGDAVIGGLRFILEGLNSFGAGR
jgi:hypothetical protein